jgi:hypothetical protein
VKISEDLIAQRDFLARSTTNWIKGPPFHVNEACMLYRAEEDSFNSFSLVKQTINTQSRIFLRDFMVERNLISDSPNCGWPTHWNDYVAESKDEVIAVLDEVIIKAQKIEGKETTK